MPKPRLRHFAAARISSQPNPAYVGPPNSTFLIRQLHDALADPTGRTSLPAAPPAGAALEDSCAYWEAALYLATYLLGWRNNAAGLAWFYSRGLDPGDDKLLGLLRDVWNSEGQLDLFAAWVCSADYVQAVGPVVVGYDEKSLSQLSKTSMPADWWAAYAAKEETLVARHPHNPRTGGTNPLHLGHALHAGLPDWETVSWFTRAEDRRWATLTLDRMAGWYWGLATEANVLLDVPGAQWRVDVVAKPVGWLGAFTRSPTSGRWHATSEEVHLAGA